MVEVVIEWSDDRMLFVEQHVYLELADVKDRLIKVYLENRFHWMSSVWRCDNKQHGLSYPVTPSYATQQFNGFQIELGQSIVIISPERQLAFKKVMNAKEENTLLRLQRLSTNEWPQIGFPT